MLPENILNKNFGDPKEIKHATQLLALMNEDNTEKSTSLLKDGTYLTNHNFHRKGERERTVKIKDGKVHTEKHIFSQYSFFDVNHVVKKIA